MLRFKIYILQQLIRTVSLFENFDKKLHHRHVLSTGIVRTRHFAKAFYRFERNLDTTCLFIHVFCKKASLRSDRKKRKERKGKKTNLLKEKPKVAYSVALMLAFISAENENRQLEDLPLADFGCLPERLLLSVRTKSINRNFVNRKLRLLSFL